MKYGLSPTINNIRCFASITVKLQCKPCDAYKVNRENFKKDAKNVLAMNSVSRSDFNNCVVSRNVRDRAYKGSC